MNRSAFTLVELLVVVVIIAILVAVALVNFANAQVRAKIAKVETEFRDISVAHGQYYIDNAQWIRDGRTNPRIPANVENRSSTRYALFELTSPIAYLSMVPYVDPFAWKAQKKKIVKGMVNDYRGMEYHYFNDMCFRVDDNGQCKPNPGTTKENIRGEFYFEPDPKLGGPVQYIWKMVSNGPAPDVEEYTHGGWKFYNPTNGLRSGGSIVRYGPQ